ncbi:hypothetical protein DPMN_013045 [Dreissena polymorpha]|uniref:Uncharacterized protein n=1 Tax=Dreissena polymorpha TaxID=45954 RepID=A0A9D4N860_DREPO|nr:hypothetical protein DPMN_013045 [Dreissena polymorpha]
MVMDINNQRKSVEINIAIERKSGTEKFRLINALRTMKADDVGDAKIGCTGKYKRTDPISV